MKNLKLAILGGLVLSASVNLAFAGNEGSGGGDANSTEIRKILTMFKNDGEKFRTELTQIFKKVVKYDPAGKTTELIHSLVNRGILEDFKQAPYVLKSICVDELGIERSATTIKVDLSGEASPLRPEICINVRKLAQEKATYENVIGLLAHEHARHFGEEDTDEYGLHPLAEFITTKYDHFFTSGMSPDYEHTLNGVLLTLYPNGNFLAASTQEGKNIELVIDQLKGECKDLHFNKGDNIYEVVRDGLRLRLNMQDVNSYTIFRSKLGYSLFRVRGICEMTYHVEVEGESSKTIVVRYDRDSSFRYFYSIKTKWLNDIE